MKVQRKFDFASWIQLPEIYSPICEQFASGKHQNFTTTWSISSTKEFWEVLESISRISKEANFDYPDTLWFRGHTKSSYVLLPSLIRSYFKNNQKSSLPQYQRKLLESFLAKSCGASELVDIGVVRRDNEQIEYIADMQHYGVPTNLLDWSEDVSVSLYFATAEQPVTDDAAIYVLNPYFYNFVRNEIIKLFPQKPHDIEGGANLDTTDTSLGGILPNFSAHFNLSALRYQNYIIGPPYWESLMEHRKWRTVDPLDDNLINQETAPLLPLAIQIPRNNPRIRRQSGMFLAYNLCEFPQEREIKSIFHGFRHIELGEIQKFYMNSDELQRRIAGKNDSPSFEAMRNRYPFLFKIQLQSVVIPDLQRIAAMLGKKRATVYPELYEIGKQIESEIPSL